jgi:hypothetical protein
VPLQTGAVPTIKSVPPIMRKGGLFPAHCDLEMALDGDNIGDNTNGPAPTKENVPLITRKGTFIPCKLQSEHGIGGWQ